MYLKKHERHFLCPKGGRHTSLPAVSETRLAFLVGDLQTPERKALAEICCLSHVFIIDDQALLLMEVSDETLETLAAFAVAEEDMENDLNDEPQPDDELGGNKEPSLGGLANMNQAGWARGGDEDREEEHDYWHDGIPPEGAKKSREAFIEARREGGAS